MTTEYVLELLRDACCMKKEIQSALECILTHPWKTPQELIEEFLVADKSTIEIKDIRIDSYKRKYVLISPLKEWWVGIELETIACPSGRCDCEIVYNVVVGNTRKQLDRELRWLGV